MTLQQQALRVVQLLPEEKLPVLIEFARFLNQSSTVDQLAPASAPALSRRRSALLGVLKGQIKMADDFNETPEAFREYL